MEAKEFNYLLKYINKDEKNFNKLYDFLLSKIVFHIKLNFGDEYLADDVVQDFFVKLRKIPYKEYIESPMGWVFKICDNIAIDNLRKYKKETALPSDSKVFTYHDKNIAEAELFGDFDSLLKKLDPHTAEIIVKSKYEGYSLKELALLYGENYNTVRQICSRGLKKLKKIYKDYKKM